MDHATLSSRLDAPIEVHDSIPNTTDRLRQRAHEGAPHGSMVVASELTAARGRTGNAWSAPPGGVWSSTLVRPSLTAAEVGRLTFAGGVAVADTVSSFGVDAQMKWPNDVVVDGRKLAGVLTESVLDGVPVAGKPVAEVFPDDDPKLDYVLLGIGINANLDPKEVRADRAVTTLCAEVGSDVDRTELVARLNENLLARCKQVESDGGFESLLDDWRETTETLGHEVRVERRGQAPVQGVARDIAETGALRIETSEGEVTVTEGECRRLRRQ